MYEDDLGYEDTFSTDVCAGVCMCVCVTERMRVKNTRPS